MRKNLLSTVVGLIVVLFATLCSAQTVVSQGTPATTSDARAWPFKVVFGGTQIDPRAVILPTVTTSGTITSTTCPGTGCVALDVTGYASAAMQITGTWDMTLIFEGSVDGTTYQDLFGTPNTSLNYFQEAGRASFEGNGTVTFSTAGLKSIRVRGFGYNSGTASIAIRASASSAPDRIIAQVIAAPASGFASEGTLALVATEATLASLKSGQTASAVNACQFDQPGTLPGNHEYTTPRCGQFRDLHVSLNSSNGQSLGEPGGVYPLTISFPAGSAGSGTSFTANGQTQAYSASSADSTSKGSYVIHIQGTWVGTIQFEGRTSSADTFAALPATNLTTGVVATTTTSNGFFVMPSSYLWEVRLETIAWTSGTATMTTATSPEVFANIVAVPIPLATGAATSANQATEIASLASIDGKTPALGQALAANSVPVILPSATITTLTPPAAITGYATSTIQTDRTQKTQVTDGTRDGTIKAASTLPALTDTAIVTTQRDPLPAGTNVIGHAIIDTGSTTAATQSTASNLKEEMWGVAKGTTTAAGITVHAIDVNTNAFVVEALQTGVWTVTTTSAAVTGNAPTAASVGVASAQALASNVSRKAAMFVNTSTNTISCAESGQAAVLNSGITLLAGAAYSMVPPFLTTGAVNCIASAAASNLSILEKQ